MTLNPQPCKSAPFNPHPRGQFWGHDTVVHLYAGVCIHNMYVCIYCHVMKCNAMHRCMDTWMHVCMYVCMYVCIYVLCMYVLMYVRLFIRTHTGMYIYIEIDR